MMTYEEFFKAISDYMNAPINGSKLALAAVLVLGGIAFAVWLVFYLRREYIRKKANTDTFDTSFAKNIQYPGFYPGGAPEKKEGKKRPDKDKWGDVNDEY